VRAEGAVSSGRRYYSRKVFIPLTNLCRDYCGYSPIAGSSEAGAHTMTPDEFCPSQSKAKSWAARTLFSLGDRRGHLPEMRETLQRLAIAARCIIWKRCANWCCAKRVCCRTPIRPVERELDRTVRASNPSLGLMLESTSTELAEAHPRGARPIRFRAAFEDDRGRRQTGRAVHHRILIASARR